MPLTSTRSPAAWAETTAARSNAKARKPERNIEFLPLYEACDAKITDTTNDLPAVRHRRRKYLNTIQAGIGCLHGGGYRLNPRTTDSVKDRPSLGRLISGSLSIQEAAAPDFQAEKRPQNIAVVRASVLMLQME